MTNNISTSGVLLAVKNAHDARAWLSTQRGMMSEPLYSALFRSITKEVTEVERIMHGHAHGLLIPPK